MPAASHAPIWMRTAAFTSKFFVGHLPPERFHEAFHIERRGLFVIQLAHHRDLPVRSKRKVSARQLIGRVNAARARESQDKERERIAAALQRTISRMTTRGGSSIPIFTRKWPTAVQHRQGLRRPLRDATRASGRDRRGLAQRRDKPRR